MKKVSLLLFVSLILLLAFSSCTKIFEEQLPEPFDPGHYHEFGTEWTIDETLHYHACECGARADYANHSDENVDGFCDGCNNSMPLPGATYTVTVKATDQNGKPFFGNTFVVNHGEDAVFDLIVGVQYTLCLGDDVVIVDTKVEDGCRVYTVKVADVTEDKSVAISTEECTHVWNPATCVTPTYCELCSFIESDPLGHN